MKENGREIRNIDIRYHGSEYGSFVFLACMHLVNVMLETRSGRSGDASPSAFLHSHNFTVSEELP